MVKMTFDRNSRGREDRSISRMDPLYMEKLWCHQPALILHSTDPTAPAWALASGSSQLSLGEGSPLSWAYEWPLSLLHRIGHSVLLIIRDFHLGGCPMRTLFMRWKYSHSALSMMSILFSRLPCHQYSSLIDSQSLTDQPNAKLLPWISVDTNLWPYRLPYEIDDHIYRQNFYPLGFPSSLLKGTIKQ